MQGPGAENAPRERDGLFDIVSRGIRATECAPMLRDASQRNGSVEHARPRRAAMLLSMRASVRGAFRQRAEESTSGCSKRGPARFHCFRLLLTMDRPTASCDPHRAVLRF